MPEAPEVAQVARGLEENLKGACIKEVKITHPKLSANMKVQEMEERLKGQHIQSVDRKGKLLIIGTEDYNWIVHLRMEGKFFVLEQEAQDPFSQKHTYARFYLEDGRILVYQDTRKFGRMYLESKDEPDSILNRQGPDVLDEQVDGDYLYKKLHKRKIPIKSALLDQKVLSGIGNIYANEILFLSKIHPAKPCNEMSLKEFQEIAFQSRRLMGLAMDQGGSTIRTFSHPGGQGGFQNHLAIYDKKECPICSTPIEKITIGQRSAYLCPNCQTYLPSQEASDPEKAR